MPRVPITEYKAKETVYKNLGFLLEDIPFNLDHESVSSLISKLDAKTRYVVKIDCGIKKRFKNGLVGLNLKADSVGAWIQETAKKGYRNFIIAKMVPHEPKEERYLSLERVRTGILLRYSPTGGVDIESNVDEVEEHTILTGKEQNLPEIGIDIAKLVQTFNLHHFSFLEINPLVIKPDGVYLLDLAVEVDTAGEFFTPDSWTGADTVDHLHMKASPQEKAIAEIGKNSSASFRYTLLNPNGSLFLLLSGGGASISLADEFYNLGYGREVANYGEYSGNPSTEESYLYTKSLLQNLLASKALHKKLIIGGGVANFTDVYKTFLGVLQALEEVKSELQKQGVKVFVRRGGPNEKKGLQSMRTFLEKNKLLGVVAGSEMPLGEIARISMASGWDFPPSTSLINHVKS